MYGRSARINIPLAPTEHTIWTPEHTQSNLLVGAGPKHRQTDFDYLNLFFEKIIKSSTF